MTRVTYHNQLALLLLWFVAGCSWGFQESNGDIPEMHQNLSRTVDIQTGVIQGNLEQATAAADWILSRQDQISFPSGGREYQDALLDHASIIASATDLGAAAVQTGRLAAACGSCHQATGGGPRFMVGTESPTGESQESQMIRHLWAADRMWEGLVGPSEEAWLAGANAFSESQPSLASELRASGIMESAEGLLREVNLLAKEALTASGQDERADIYGRLLTTCNRCHGSSGFDVLK